MSNTDLTLFACPHPFSHERIERKIAQGSTVEEILAEANISLAAATSLTTYVYVDNHLIPREMWPIFIPESKSVVTVRVAPGGGGGGGGKDPLRVVLTLSVIALSLAVPHLGVFAAKGALAGWGGVAGFAVAVGGMLAVNALVPPQSSKVNNYNTTTLYNITGAQNQADPWGPCLKIFGKRRVYPRLAAMPYTELVGSDQYLRCLFDVGYSPMELSDHKIGETVLDEFEEVQYEIYQNDEYFGDDPDDDNYSVYPENVHEDQLSIELTQAVGWEERTTQTGTDEISFDLTFPGGLWFYSDAHNRREKTTVQFECQYCVTGTENWIDFFDNAFQTLVFSDYPSETIAAGDTVTQASSGASGTVTFAGHARRRTSTGYYDGDGRLKYTYERYTKLVNVTLSTGVFTVGSVTIVGKDTATVSRATTPTLNVSGKYDNLHRLGYTIKVPTGQYDIRWRRLTADHGSSEYSDSSYITALRSLSYSNPVNLLGRCLVALRIKASDQLSGMIDQYNCIAEALLPAHDGVSWNVVKTRSPAWAFADVLRGAGNKRAIADAKIDIDGLRAWDLRCEANSRHFDAVVDSQFTVFDLLTNIAATGRATPGLKDSSLGFQFSVVEDIEQTVPVQHFTPRNSWGFTGSKLFPDKPHAFKCRFENEDTDYQADELIVCDDGYYSEIPAGTTYWQASTAYATNDYCIATPDDGYYYRATASGTSGGTQPTWPSEIAATVSDGGSIIWICEDQASRFETMDFWGYTESDHVWSDARWMIACARLRPEVFTFNTDVEHIVCTRGDLIRVSHDVLSIGLGQARITAIATTGGGDVTACTIDSAVTMATGTNYGVRIRKSDGTSVTATVVNDPGEQYYLEFSPSISAATAPGIGDLLQFGELSNESIECIVTRIEPGPNLSAKITCIHAAPAVHDADQELIPDFVTNITKPPIVNRVPPTPEIVDYRYDAHWISQRDDGSYQIIMTVTFALPTTTAPTGFGVTGRVSVTLPSAIVQGYQAQYREEDGTWISLPLMDDHARKFNFEVANGATYDFRVRSFSSRSNFSDWDTVSDVTVSVATIYPPDVTNLQVKGGGTTFGGRDCMIEWDDVSGGGTDGAIVTGYEIRILTTGDVLLASINDWPDTNYTYTYENNKVDNSGTAIRNIKFKLRAKNKWGILSSNYATLTASNPAPDMSGVTPTVTSRYGFLEISWAAQADYDMDYYVVYCDSNNPPTTMIDKVKHPGVRAEAMGLDYGTTYYVKVVPYDQFGVGTASQIQSGTTLEIPDINVNLEAQNTVTISQDASAFSGILDSLYDGILTSGGVTSSDPSTHYIKYTYKMGNYFDRVGIWCNSANPRVYIGISEDDVNYTYYKCDSGHAPDPEYKLAEADNESDAITNYWQLAAGKNFALLPDNQVGLYVKLCFVNTNAVQIFEFVPSRILIAELAAIGHLASISTNVGVLLAGIIQSSNWGADQGFYLDLTNERLRMGGSSAPALDFDAANNLFKFRGVGEFIGDSNYNMLKNPGFEETDESGDSYWWTTATYIETNTDGGEDSNNYLTITRDSGTDRLAYYLGVNGSTQYFEVNEGEVYEFGGDLRSDTIATARMALTYCDKDKSTISSLTVESTSISFESKRNTYTVGSGAKFIRIAVSTVTANGICDFDNLFLRKIDRLAYSWTSSSDRTVIDGGMLYVGSSILVGSGATDGKISIANSTFGSAGIQLHRVSSKNYLYAGDGSNEYLKYTTDDGIVISTAKANAITLKLGADIVFEADDSSPAEIIFKDSGAGTYHASMGRDATYNRCYFKPTTDGTCQFYIGDSTPLRWGSVAVFSGGTISLVHDDYSTSDISQLELSAKYIDLSCTDYGNTTISQIELIAAAIPYIQISTDFMRFLATELAAGDVSNNSLYINSSTHKLTWRDGSGNSYALY